MSPKENVAVHSNTVSLGKHGSSETNLIGSFSSTIMIKLLNDRDEI